MTCGDKNEEPSVPDACKLKAIKRVERGEGVLPVARELGISRKILHDWIKAWKVHGPEGLNRKPAPTPGPRKLKPVPTYDDSAPRWRRSATPVRVHLASVHIQRD